MSPSVVQVVHCIDTEGPLHEPLAATFQRLESIYGLSFEPKRETLLRLQRREIPLDGLEDEVARTFSPQNLGYNDGWDSIDAMLAEMMSPGFRQAEPDSFGGGWVYNWFCLDHVGFTANPRRRDMGFHNIRDHYRQAMLDSGSGRDGLHFHHHPLAFSREANRCATHFFSHTPIIFEILARCVIERRWFPCAYRPGFHVIRPDSAWFLEQYIPFDFSNQSTDEDYSRQRDLAAGRFGDWRRAPRSWTPYHPDHDDYQSPGNCRRWTARCLNVGTRLRLMTQADVDLAFREAAEGKPVVLAFTNHDFRDMRPDVALVRSMLADAAARYPGVRYRFAEARDAMRSALDLPVKSPLTFEMRREGSRLSITSSGRLFGPQPFLALATRDRRFLHDNLDIQRPFHEWSYVLDEDTMVSEALASIGVAGCDETGNVTVAVMNPADGKVEIVHH